VPDKYKVFSPECTTVDVATADQSELINSYNNTIVYTDHLIHSVIEMLKNEFPDRRSCVIFISDHGESLGEDGNYMHGVPKSMAPAEQTDIPLIVWTSDDSLKIKDIPEAEHYNIYHSVMKFLGMTSPIYDESKNIFE
jgi:lipid A ethanolaminephosphotransferase